MTSQQDKKIQELKKKYRSEQSSRTTEQYWDRQDRLKLLVEKHGVDRVANAADLSVATLRQYIRVSVPPSISESSVKQAEVILQEL